MKNLFHKFLMAFMIIMMAATVYAQNPAPVYLLKIYSQTGYPITFSGSVLLFSTNGDRLVQLHDQKTPYEILLQGDNIGFAIKANGNKIPLKLELSTPQTQCMLAGTGFSMIGNMSSNCENTFIKVS